LYLKVKLFLKMIRHLIFVYNYDLWLNIKLKSNATYHPFVLPKLMWLLKSQLDQNPIMIYHKFNGNFKSHMNFERIKGGQWDDMLHYSRMK